MPAPVGFFKQQGKESTMTTSTQSPTGSLSDLLALLNQFPESCDPDFDNSHEELEREFAALRLTCSHN
jgi:hypothetical protein